MAKSVVRNTSFVWICIINSIINASSHPNVTVEDIAATFDDAEAFCAFSYGTSLTSIHNDFDNAESQLVCSQASSSCWIGLHCPDVWGNWQWTDGTPFDYGTNTSGGVYPWGMGVNGEPNNSGNENCVCLRKNAGYNWNDQTCNTLYRALCKYPSSNGMVIIDDTTTIQPAVNGSVGTMDILDEFYIAFDFILYSYHATSSGNILHIGSTFTKLYPAISVNGPNTELVVSFDAHKDYVYNPIELNSWYHLEFDVTQSTTTTKLNDTVISNDSNITSHSVVMQQPIYISSPWFDPMNGTIRNLKITTTNAYVTHFNYLCDYLNRFTYVKGTWSLFETNCCIIQMDFAEANIVWLSDMQWADYKVEVVFSMSDGSGNEQAAGLLFRTQAVSADITLTSGGQTYFLYVDASAKKVTVSLAKINDGWTVLNSYSSGVNHNFNVNRTLRVEAVSEILKIYLDNNFVFNYTPSEYMYGSIGLMTWGTSAIFQKLRIVFPETKYINPTIATHPPTSITIDPITVPTTIPTTALPTTASTTTSSPTTASPTTASPTTASTTTASPTTASPTTATESPTTISTTIPLTTPIMTTSAKTTDNPSVVSTNYAVSIEIKECEDEGNNVECDVNMDDLDERIMETLSAETTNIKIISIAIIDNKAVIHLSVETDSNQVLDADIIRDHIEREVEDDHVFGDVSVKQTDDDGDHKPKSDHNDIIATLNNPSVYVPVAVGSTMFCVLSLCYCLYRKQRRDAQKQVEKVAEIVQNERATSISSAQGHQLDDTVGMTQPKHANINETRSISSGVQGHQSDNIGNTFSNQWNSNGEDLIQNEKMNDGIEGKLDERQNSDESSDDDDSLYDMNAKQPSDTTPGTATKGEAQTAGDVLNESVKAEKDNVIDVNTQQNMIRDPQNAVITMGKHSETLK